MYASCGPCQQLGPNSPRCCEPAAFGSCVHAWQVCGLTRGVIMRVAHTPQAHQAATIARQGLVSQARHSTARSALTLSVPASGTCPAPGYCLQP